MPHSLHLHPVDCLSPLCAISPRGKKMNGKNPSTTIKKKKPVFERRKASDGAEFFSVSCPLFTHHFHHPHKSGSHSPHRTVAYKTSLRKKIKKDPVVDPDLFVAFNLRSCLPLVPSLLQPDLLVVLWHELFLEFIKLQFSLYLLT